MPNHSEAANRKQQKIVNILVRPQGPDDDSAIEKITIDAFANSEFGHNGEADLVTSLRTSGTNQLSLVACIDDVVVGHCLFTPVEIRRDDHIQTGMGLAPLSVATAHQRKGIGTALVNAALEELTSEGCAFVVVLGHADYYARFGFSPAADFGIRHGFEGIPHDVFFIKQLQSESSHPFRKATTYYREEFGPQSEAWGSAG